VCIAFSLRVHLHLFFTLQTMHLAGCSSKRLKIPSQRPPSTTTGHQNPLSNRTTQHQQPQLPHHARPHHKGNVPITKSYLQLPKTKTLPCSPPRPLTCGPKKFSAWPKKPQAPTCSKKAKTRPKKQWAKNKNACVKQPLSSQKKSPRDSTISALRDFPSSSGKRRALSSNALATACMRGSGQRQSVASRKSRRILRRRWGHG